MAEKEIPLTKEGYQRMVKKLEYFKITRRKEVAERIRQAKEFGDVGENNEYEDAKNEQAFVEGEIINLEKILRNARIIDEGQLSNDLVSIGSKVRIMNMSDGKKYTFTMVGSTETDPEANLISNESPLGKALFTHKKGEVVEVEAPAGVFAYKILDINQQGEEV